MSLDLSLDEVLERFEAEYVAERKEVEEPDPLLVDVHSWLVALRAVRDAGLAAQKAMMESTALCPLCQGEPDEHGEKCPLGTLADALAATTEEPGEDARVGVTDTGRAAIVAARPDRILVCPPGLEVPSASLGEDCGEDDGPCWCGVQNPYREPPSGPCGGDGHVTCDCGGDTCVCHHHGEAPCPGCADCAGDTWDEEDD